MHIEIKPFEEKHQNGVDEMLSGIAAEYPEQIYSPGFMKMEEAALIPGHKYWVALADNEVIGTIGYIEISNQSMVLKRMFLSKKYRGSGVSGALLGICMDDAARHGMTKVYLGTMEQFKAAQRFYEKNGFTRIAATDLPADFKGNNMDTVFYKKQPNE